VTSDLRPLTSELRGLRVCFLAGTLGQGGAERQLFYIASALKRSGAQVQVLSLTDGECWQSRLQQIGVPVVFVGDSRSRLKRLVTITRAVMAFRPHIVQSQHFYTNAYSGLAARLTRARAIGAVRGSGTADIQNCGSGLASACLRFPHLLAVNSRAAVRAMITLGCPAHKLHYFPNVIDLELFRPGQPSGSQPLTILGVGRLGPEKRFDRFLRVLALLQQSQTTPFRALIVGDGPLRTNLEQGARAAGFYPGIVRFCGTVPDTHRLYRKAHLLLMTSDHEGTPNVVMEAMASGLPVVATAVGGVPELIQNGATGFLAQPCEEHRLAQAIGRLLIDDALRREISGRARAFIEARHSLSSLSAQLQALYRSLLPKELSMASPVQAKAV